MRFSVLSIILFMLLFSCLPAVAADPNQIYVDGLSLYQDGNYSAAEQKLQEALAQNPKHLSSLFLMGETLSKDIRRLREAEGWYKKALRDGAKDKVYTAKTRYSLGTLYIQLGLYEEAVKQFQELVALSPDYYDIARVYNKMGVARARLDQYDEALDCFKKALRRDPSILEATFNMKALQGQLSLVNIARYYERMGDDKAALEQYDKAVEAHPNYVAAWYHLGVLELKMKDYTNSVRHLTRAWALNAGYMGGLELPYQLAQAHEARNGEGDLDAAYGLYRKTQAYKDSAIRAGVVLLGLGKPDAARDELAAAADTYDDKGLKAEAFYQLGRAFESKKDNAQAAGYFRKAAVLMPDEPKYRR